MEIKSESGLGKIYAGDTDLACSIEFLPGDNPNDLVMSAGSLTIAGNTYEFDAQAFALPDGIWRIQVGKWDDGEPTLEFLDANAFLPGNWQQIQILAGFGNGINVVDGSIVGDVYVFEVLPGFPE